MQCVPGGRTDPPDSHWSPIAHNTPMRSNDDRDDRHDDDDDDDYDDPPLVTTLHCQCAVMMIVVIMAMMINIEKGTVANDNDDHDGPSFWPKFHCLFDGGILYFSVPTVSLRYIFFKVHFSGA